MITFYHSFITIRTAGVYARVTEVMEWIAKNIQDGECHYAHDYIQEVIEKKRVQETKREKHLKNLFTKIKEERKNDLLANTECKCPKCHPEVPRITQYREMNCWNSTGKYMSSYRSILNKKCKVELQEEMDYQEYMGY